MAHSATITHPGATPHRHHDHEDDVAHRTVEADPGPWLILLGPLTLFLTVVAVSWLSMISF